MRTLLCARVMPVSELGSFKRETIGAEEGIKVGVKVGSKVGVFIGTELGRKLGVSVGDRVGACVVGLVLGYLVGLVVGEARGEDVGFNGFPVGDASGSFEGLALDALTIAVIDGCVSLSCLGCNVMVYPCPRNVRLKLYCLNI